MKRFKFIIPAERPFPANALPIVEGICREHRIHSDNVCEALTGVLVEGIFPEDFTELDISAARGRLVESVQRIFAEVQKHQRSTATVINNFTANQVAAQGVHAVAIGNTLVQQQLDPSEACKLAEELRLLREALQTSISNAQDAIEVGVVAEAEEAAKNRNGTGLLAAVRKWGAKALHKVAGLGLSLLHTYIATQAGIPLPPPSATLPAGDDGK